MDVCPVNLHERFFTSLQENRPFFVEMAENPITKQQVCPLPVPSNHALLVQIDVGDFHLVAFKLVALTLKLVSRAILFEKVLDYVREQLHILV